MTDAIVRRTEHGTSVQSSPPKGWRQWSSHHRATYNTWRFKRRHDPISRRIAAKQNAVAALIVLVAVLVALCALTAWTGLRMWNVPQWYLASRASVGVGVAINEYRTALAPVFSALVQAAGALLIVAGTAVAWRQFALVQRQHVSDVFSRAAEHLASERIELRVNGIRDLESLLIQDPDQLLRIADSLATFVRQRTSSISAASRIKNRDDPDAIQDIREAIQTSSRIGRNFKRPQPKSPYLSSLETWHKVMDFSGVDFSGLPLKNLQFVGAALDGANFGDTDLSGTLLEACSARRAQFDGATFTGSQLLWMSCENANFRGAHFSSARLLQNVFTSTDFSGAHFLRTSFDRDAMLFANFDGSHIETSVLGAYNWYSVSFRNAVLIDLDLRGNHDVGRTPALRDYVAMFGSEPTYDPEARNTRRLHWTGPRTRSPYDGPEQELQG